MSGPKVIRIVTRQEILDICYAQLAQIDAAIAEWERVRKRINVVAGVDHATVLARRQEVVKLIKTDQFLQAQKQAPLVVDWIRSDLSTKLEEQHLAEAQARRVQRSLQITAQTLLGRIAQQSTKVPDDTRRLLEAAASGKVHNRQDIEKGISRAIVLTATNADSKSSERQRELASKLGAGEIGLTLDEWLKAQGIEEKEDPRFQIIERQLSQLAQFGVGDASGAFVARADLLRNEKDARRQSLLLDSFCIELSSEVRIAKERAELRQGVSDVRAEASAVGELESCVGALNELEKLVLDGTLQVARERLERLREYRASCAKKRAAESGRKAILRGLKGLGYDVREGMTTTWTQSKRLVVRNPQNPGVALEMGGSVEAKSLQVRMVAVQGVSREPVSDRQTEEQWCGELSRLQELVAKEGAAIVIERATPAGTHPLKVVPNEWQEDDDENEAPRQRGIGF